MRRSSKLSTYSATSSRLRMRTLQRSLDSEAELESLEMPTPSSPSSPATTQLSSLFSDALSGLSTTSSRSGSLSPLSSPTPTGSHSRRSESICSRTGTKNEVSEGSIGGRGTCRRMRPRRTTTQCCALSRTCEAVFRLRSRTRALALRHCKAVSVSYFIRKMA